MCDHRRTSMTTTVHRDVRCTVRPGSGGKDPNRIFRSHTMARRMRDAEGGIANVGPLSDSDTENTSRMSDSEAESEPESCAGAPANEDVSQETLGERRCDALGPRLELTIDIPSFSSD